MGQIKKLIIPFWISALVASVLANIFSTQFVVAGLNAVGGEIDMAGRLTMTSHDLLSFGPIYTLFIAIGLLIAFIAAELVYRRAQTKRTLIYVVAGIACFIVMLWAMKNLFFGVQLVAGARTLFGVFFQAISGAIAGYVYAKLSAPKTA